MSGGWGGPYTLTVMLNVTMKLVPLLHFLKKTSPVAETKTECVDKVSLEIITENKFWLNGFD